MQRVEGRSYFWEFCSRLAAFWGVGFNLARVSQPRVSYSTQSVPWLWPSRKWCAFSLLSTTVWPAEKQYINWSMAECKCEFVFMGVCMCDLCSLPPQARNNWRVVAGAFPRTLPAAKPPPPSARKDLWPHLCGIDYVPGTQTRISTIKLFLFYAHFSFRSLSLSCSVLVLINNVKNDWSISPWLAKQLLFQY